MPEISVIVPAHNAAATIGATLAALAEQDTDRAYEVIVVDDGSADDTVAVAEAAPGPVRVVAQAQAGPGPARDRGVAEASGSLLAFTDADCVPVPDWLRAGTAALDHADLIQGAVRPDEEAVRRPFDRTIWVDGAGGLYETANLLVRRELFDRIGGFEDWLGPDVLGKPLAEDVWFGWRARRAGARVAYSERALVRHAVFERGAIEYAGERLRLAYFPAIVAKMPELRAEALYRGLFLSRRTAAFDLAVAGTAVALVARTPLPLVAAAPYARLLATATRRWGRRAPAVAVVEAAADAVGLAALLAGSVRRRTPVL